MHLLRVPEPGVVELNYMWLPTFLGMNSRLKQDIEKELGPKFQGRALDENFLNEADEIIVDFILKKFPNIVGLRDYLDAIKFVQET